MKESQLLLTVKKDSFKFFMDNLFKRLMFRSSFKINKVKSLKLYRFQILIKVKLFYNKWDSIQNALQFSWCKVIWRNFTFLFNLQKIKQVKILLLEIWENLFKTFSKIMSLLSLKSLWNCTLKKLILLYWNYQSS